MISSENSSGLATDAIERMRISSRLGGRHRAVRGQLRRAVLDDDDRRVGDLADGDAQAGEREQVDRLLEGRPAAAP